MRVRKLWAHVLHYWISSSKQKRVVTAASFLLAIAILVVIIHPQANAGTAYLSPDGNVQSNWTTTGTGNSACPGHCGFINENYAAPDTSNYISSNSTAIDEFTMSSFALPPGTTTSNSVTVYIYDDSATNANGGTMDPVNITIGTGGVYQTAVAVTPVYGSWGWQSATFNVAWTQSQLDAMQVQLSSTTLGSGKPSAQQDTLNVATMYATVDYTTNVSYTQAAYRWFSNWDSQQPGLSVVNPTSGSDIARKAVSDGTNLYVGGTTSTNGNDWRIEKRSILDGSMVTSFGTSGVVNDSPSANDDMLRSLALGSSSLYAIGYDSAAGTADQEWRIEKRDTDTGNFVSGFGTGGIVTENPTSAKDSPQAITTDTNNIFIGGYDSQGGNEWRLEKRDKASGALVASFGTGGVITENPSSGDDKITSITSDASYLYIGGYDSQGGTSEIRIEKRDINTGALVASFGTGGVITEDIYTGISPGFAEDTIGAGGLTISNGALIVAGSDYAPGNAEWRIESRSIGTGALNTSFGTNGVIQENASAYSDTISSVQTDGTNIYLGGIDQAPGSADSEYRMEERALSSGSLVTAFGSSGIKTNNPSTGTDSLTDLVYSGGHLYAVGSDNSPGNDEWRIEARNTTSGSLGFPLAGQNSAATIPQQGTPFRLRMLLSVGTNAMYKASDTLKLQVAVKSGTCSGTPSANFTDLSNTTGDIRYAANPTPVNAAATSSISDDPTDGTNTVLAQTYTQLPTFTNSVSDIGVGQDGLWDFSLVNYSAPAATTYCIRAVKQSGTALSSYTTYPEFTTSSEDKGVQYLSNHTSVLATGATSVAASGSNKFFLDFYRTDATANEFLTPSVELQNTTTGFTGTSNYTGSGNYSTMTVPNIRFASCYAYDSTAHRMIVFGGEANDGSTNYNDAWALNMPANAQPSWQVLTANGATGSPPVTRSCGATYDSTGNRFIVFGGWDGTTNYNSVWALSLNGTPTWSQLSPSGTAPSARRTARIDYDPVGNQIFMFAGYDGTTYDNDLYKLTLGSTPTWSQVTPSGGPPTARGGQAQAFDPVGRAIYVVDGTTATAGELNDTWKYDIAANTWTQIYANGCTGTCPLPFEGPSLVYDSVNKQMVFFGGHNFGKNSGISAQDNNTVSILTNLSTTPTWATPTVGSMLPAPRYYLDAAYDPLNQRMIIFSGKNVQLPEMMKDVSSLSLPTGGGTLYWSGAPTNVLMNGHDQMDPFFDATSNYLYLSEGYGNGTMPTANDTGGHVSETYRLDLTNQNRAPRWRNVSPQAQTPLAAPNPREASAFAKDTLRNRLLIFGGLNLEFTYNDVWAENFNGSGTPTWTQLCNATSCGTPPPSRWLTQGVYDAANDRFIVFGGLATSSFGGTNYNDVWALSLSGTPTWTQLSPSGSAPAGRWGGAVVYDQTNQRMVLFGGDSSSTSESDTWALSLGASPAWTQLSPTGTAPTARRSPSYALSSYGGVNKMIVFGGFNEGSSTHYNDIYSLDLSTTNGAWTALSPNDCSSSTAPACRRSAMGAYDPNNNTFLVAAGRNATIFYNDAYSFNLTQNTWTNLNPVSELGFSVPITGLADNAYHWQYWTTGSTSGAGYKQPYGSNNDTPVAATDFASCSPPTVSNRLRTNSYFCGLSKQNKFIGLTTQ